MAKQRIDITRSRDLYEKVLISLAVAVATCTGFHHLDARDVKAAAAILSGPGGCAQPPSFILGVQAQVASDEDLIPAPRAKAARTTTTTKTTQPTTPTP